MTGSGSSDVEAARATARRNTAMGQGQESPLRLMESWGQDAGAPGVGRGSHDLLAFGGLLLCTAIAAVLAGTSLVWVGGQVPQVRHTAPVFDTLEDRPDRARGPAASAVNILLVGTDRRSSVPTTGSDAGAPAWLFGEQRADTVMLVHVAADRSSAHVISMPRDSWVEVPGYGWSKLNAAYSWGGLSLMVETVEDLTDIRVDHVALVDFSGFAAVVDTVGGVEVTIPETVVDSARDVTWPAGKHLLDGDAALAYAGQRYGLVGGDLDRVRRQQALLRGLVRSTLRSGLRSDLQLLVELTGEVLQHVSVDETWSLDEIVGFVWSLRGLRAAEVEYLTAPALGTGYVGDQSVVRLDRRLGSALWAAVRRDRATAWLADHPELRTPETVR